MASPPASTKTSLGQKLRARARERWPELAGVTVRFRGPFAYVTGQLPDGQELPLCRLRYVGYASTWGFAIYRASHDDYQDNYLPSGRPSGTPEEALDCACGLYLGDPSAWLSVPPTDTPTDLRARALASQVTGWLLATQARLGLTGQARATIAALGDQRASSGEIGNARAVICLAEGDPAGALAAVAGVLAGTAPVLGYTTVLEAHLLAGLAHRALGDQRAAGQAAERALALAEADRLILPFAMTGSAALLEALPRHQTAHAALLADILDVLHGAAPAAAQQPAPPPAEELSPGELKVLRYLPTNLSRPEIAGELSVSPNTVNAHIRSIYAKLGVRDRSSAVRRARQLRLLAAAGRTR